jgi:hypothetical protein
MSKYEERRQKMMILVEEWQKSGQAQKAFAQAKNIKLFTFRYWIQKQNEVQQQDDNRLFLQLSPVSVRLFKKLCQFHLHKSPPLIVSQSLSLPVLQTLSLPFAPVASFAQPLR